MADRLCKVVKGKVLGNRLIIGTSTFITLKGNNMYNGKYGYFLVKDGIVYKFIPITINPL